MCPYTDATQSGVIMTAFALGRPVIATDVGGFSDVITHEKTGLLVKPKDVDDLYNKILYLLNNVSLRLEMEKNIKAFRSRAEFNWGNIAEKYIKLYLEIYNSENSNSN